MGTIRVQVATVGLVVALAVFGITASTSSAATEQSATWSGALSFSRSTNQSTSAFCWGSGGTVGAGTVTMQATEEWTFTIPRQGTIMGAGSTARVEGTLSGTGTWISTRTCNGVEDAHSTAKVSGTAAYGIDIEQLDATGDKIALATDGWHVLEGIPGTQTVVDANLDGGGFTRAVHYWPGLTTADIDATSTSAGATTFKTDAPADVSPYPAFFIVNSVDSSVSFDWGTALLDVDLTRGDRECTIEGTEGDDRLVGTSSADVICGYGGNDHLFGMGGDDILRGGAGEDDLIGGPGEDLLEGGLDADALRGDEGDDILDGGAGIDLVTYFTIKKKVTVDLGRHTARSAPHGTDTLKNIEGAFGSKTGDLLIGSSGSNHLFGGPGKDTIRGMGGTDLLHGNAGSDVLEGGGGGDMLFGDEGQDTLNGGSSKDGCYDTAAKRSSCEYDEKDDPKKGGQPPTNARQEVTTGWHVAADRAAGTMSWRSLGNNDFLVVYDTVATQSLGYWAGTSTRWEKWACRAIRYTPARGACSASNALQAISKYQMRWFLWNAKRNGGCAIAILDWGHHGVNQFQKRWKVRSADYYRYNVAIPWVTPGRITYVKTGSGGSTPVKCS